MKSVRPYLDRTTLKSVTANLICLLPPSHAQLAEHYQHCLKLSAENKVSAKNAFNLQLIDWMAQAIKKQKTGGADGVDMGDFQVAEKLRNYAIDVLTLEVYQN